MVALIFDGNSTSLGVAVLRFDAAVAVSTCTGGANSKRIGFGVVIRMGGAAYSPRVAKAAADD